MKQKYVIIGGRKYKTETMERIARERAEAKPKEEANRKAHWKERISNYRSKGWHDLADTEEELFQAKHGESSGVPRPNNAGNNPHYPSL